MEIKDFIEKFARVFDDTDTSLLKPDTKFKELEEWSSLTSLGVIALVDEEFDVELSGNEIRKSETIRDLFDIIQSK